MEEMSEYKSVVAKLERGQNIFRASTIRGLLNELESTISKKDVEIADLSSNCTQCKEPVWCEVKGQLKQKDTTIAERDAEIAGLRSKHGDYEHPQDSIDRGRVIDQLKIDKANLKSEIARLKRELGQEEDSGSYDSLIPSESWVGKSAQTIKFVKEQRAACDRTNP
jgi:predicted  nucleic acid-binding Zn-ribbon protein